MVGSREGDAFLRVICLPLCYHRRCAVAIRVAVSLWPYDCPSFLRCFSFSTASPRPRMSPPESRGFAAAAEPWCASHACVLCARWYGSRQVPFSPRGKPTGVEGGWLFKPADTWGKTWNVQGRAGGLLCLLIIAPRESCMQRTRRRRGVFAV